MTRYAVLVPFVTDPGDAIARLASEEVFLAVLRNYGLIVAGPLDITRHERASVDIDGERIELSPLPGEIPVEVMYRVEADITRPEWN